MMPPEGAAEERSITHKILHETTRFAVVQLLSALLTWGAQIVLARLLERRDFGVFGICTFYIGLGQLLGDGGLGATLLRRKGEVTSDEYRSTMTSLLVVASVFAIALFALAPWLAEYNHLTARETLMLRAMSPLYLVNALRVVPYVRLERNLDFSTIAHIELAASVAKHSAALVIAAIHGSVWALIGSQLAGAIVQLVAAYRASPGWVSLGFSWRVFRPLIAYGSKVQSLTLCAYFKDNMSRAMLGGWIGPTAVGLYDFGMGYIVVPVLAVNGLARVQLPVYARLEARDPALYSALRGAMRTAALVGIPLLGLLALGSSWAIPFIYGDKWAPAYPVIWGILINMVCSLVLSPLFTLLQGQGRAGLAIVVFASWTSATWLLAVGGLLLHPNSLGIVAWGQSVATVGVTIYLVLWTSRHLARNAMGGLVVPLLSGVAGLSAAGVLRFYGGAQVGHPLVASLAFLVTYVAGLWLFERKLVGEEMRVIFRSLGGHRRAQ